MRAFIMLTWMVCGVWFVFMANTGQDAIFWAILTVAWVLFGMTMFMDNKGYDEW